MSTLVNCYQRHYFVSADGNYRLTVDWNLRFAGFAHLAAAGTLSAAGPSVIIELKYAPCHADQAADAVSNALPLRLARCSKYVLGIQRTTSGALP
jgi:hypothetical protein